VSLATARGGAAASRALVISERDVEPWLAFAAWTEWEDLLRTSGATDLYRLERRGEAPPVRMRRVLGRSLRHARSTALLPARRGAPRLLGERYDVAIAVLNSVWNTPLLESIPGLRDAADGIVGWFPEVWPSQLHRDLVYEPFHLLDEIFVGEPRSAELLGRLLGRTVHILSLATDVERFSGAGRALEATGERPIDVFNLGRREPRLHEALVAWAGRTGAFYLYDTTRGATVVDPTVHRSVLADELQRTKVKVTSYAKHTEPEVIGDLRWIPSRVFDGLASGAILAGYAPSTTAQRELFGRDVVHPLPENDPAAAAAAIARLVTDGSTMERRANVRTAMLAHDWSHRWVELYRACGLEPPARLAERASRLTREAEAAATTVKERV
jgi:hypothetical protein